MKLLPMAASLVVCISILGCSGGPKDEDVVNGARAFLAANQGLVADGVKNLGCEKAKPEEVKDSGEFYRCQIQTTVGSRVGKDRLYFQNSGENWIPRGG